MSSNTEKLKAAVTKNIRKNYNLALNDSRKQGLLLDGVLIGNGTGDIEKEHLELMQGVAEIPIKYLKEVATKPFVRLCLRDIKIELIKEKEVRQAERSAAFIEEVESDPNYLGEPGKDFFLVRDIQGAGGEDGFVVDAQGKVSIDYTSFENMVKQRWPDPKDPDRPLGILIPQPCKVDWRPFYRPRYTEELTVTSITRKHTLNVYNSWQSPEYLVGYPWENYEPRLPEHYKKFFEHLVDSNEEELEVLYWALGMIVRGKKPENIFLLFGEGGIGKSIFVEEFMSHLCGHANVAPTDAKSIVKEFNADTSEKSVIYLEEQESGIEAVNKLKAMTNETTRVRKMRTDAYKAKNFASIWVLANPDVAKIQMQANERRFYAFPLTSTKLESRFGPESAIVEAVKSGKEIGNLYAYLTQVYQGKYSFEQVEIKRKNAYFRKMVVAGYENSARGFHQILEAILASSNMDPVSSYISTGGKDNKRVTRNAIEDLLASWGKENPLGKTVMIAGELYIQPLVNSLDELIYGKESVEPESVATDEFNWEDL